MLNLLVLSHFAFCLIMCGLIWVIQVLHYPTFKFIKEDTFKRFESFHVKRISFIVIPIMVLELLTSILLFLYFPNTIVQINVLLLILTWLSTFIFSMPIHNQLLKEYNINFINKLILTNWPRTALWSIRAILIFQLIYTHLRF